MLIEKELNRLEEMLRGVFADSGVHIAESICSFLTAKSKRLRSSMVFLFSKALNIEITDSIYALACALELLHNASLIHDDILDNSDKRRGAETLNCTLGSSLSVLAGDILTAAAFKQLAKCSKPEVSEIFTDCLYNMCRGEITQNFTAGKAPSMEEYIQKSEYKTAELFKAGLLSLCSIADIPYKEEMGNFARSFGIAFQIKDDLTNILCTDKSKPAESDIYNGIFTAPVIFLNEDAPIEDLSAEKISELAKNKKYVIKTKEMIKEYALKAAEAASFAPDNEYKKEIIKTAENLYKAGIDE